MTKSEAKSQLIKDIIFAVVAWIIGTIFFASTMDESFAISAIPGFFLSGIPFGWRWLSKIFISLSLPMVFIKAILSLVLGFIALPITIIKDIMTFVTAEN